MNTLAASAGPPSTSRVSCTRTKGTDRPPIAPSLRHLRASSILITAYELLYLSLFLACACHHLLVIAGIWTCLQGVFGILDRELVSICIEAAWTALSQQSHQLCRSVCNASTLLAISDGLQCSCGVRRQPKVATALHAFTRSAAQIPLQAPQERLCHRIQPSRASARIACGQRQ